MGITKKEIFSEDINQLADQLKAIGHPARLSIMILLSQKDNCICDDINQEIPLAQPTISRHLSELKKVGLIQGTISGKNICYCINQEAWEQLKVTIGNISTDQSNLCC